MAVSQLSERFRANKQRVSNSSFQPDACVKPILSHHCPSEPNAALHYDSRLLCVDGDRTVSSGGCDITIKCFAQDSWFAAKVIGEWVASARMPDVPRDETMAAFRAAPQLFGLLWNFNSHSRSLEL